MPRFLSVCLNPTSQRTITLDKLERGEVNRAKGSRLDASGKGINLSRVLTQLGGEVRHLTHLGPGRKEFLRLCAADGLEVFWRKSTSPIRTCITLLEPLDQSTTEIVEPTVPVNEVCVKEIRKLFAKQLLWADWVILSGSKAPGYPPLLFADFCREAAAKGIPVAVDYRGEELISSLAHRPTLVKINLVEFCRTFLPEMKVSEADDEKAIPEVKDVLSEKSADGTDFVITRGSRDMLCARSGEIFTVTPLHITPVNTIGSGDATMAGMVHALSSGADLKTAAVEGARCGAENAVHLKPGSIN